MQQFDFDDRLRMSCGVAVNPSIEAILLAQIPGAVWVKLAKKQHDKNGTDWWVHCESGHDLSVDLKAREEDFLAKGKDDLALEIWNDRDRQVIGWTLRTDKRTDYILWFWQDTKRWCLVPFPMLCKVFWKHRRDWEAKFKHAEQESFKDGRRWISECLFVPRRDVWVAIYKNFAKGYLSEDAIA
jgi:hypothetical protein